MSPDQDIAMSNGIMAPNSNSEPLEYYYQKQHAWCSHTINRFGKGSPNLDKQHKAGKIPRLFLNDMCSDCTARQKLSGQSPDTHISVLRSQINGYVTKLDDNSREAVDMRASLNKANAELEKLREKVKTLSAENTQLNMKYNSQGSEVGKLRKQVREISEGRLPNGLTIVQKQAAEFTQDDCYNRLHQPNCLLFLDFEKGLVEHRWDPFVRSLFTELQEAVRRNDFEEICEIHDRMQSFAEAFDNELKERIEKAEKEIIKQCEEGVQRLLSTMF